MSALYREWGSVTESFGEKLVQTVLRRRNRLGDGNPNAWEARSADRDDEGFHPGHASAEILEAAVDGVGAGERQLGRFLEHAGTVAAGPARLREARLTKEQGAGRDVCRNVRLDPQLTVSPKKAPGPADVATQDLTPTPTGFSARSAQLSRGEAGPGLAPSGQNPAADVSSLRTYGETQMAYAKRSPGAPPVL